MQVTSVPTSTRLVTAASAELDRLLASYAGSGDGADTDGPDGADRVPGQIVRDKTHPSIPMSAQDAVEQLELVGHDFYLFTCAETGKPSVVYRRKAYDYGVIRLAEAPPAG